jgi:hypothetical protein
VTQCKTCKQWTDFMEDHLCPPLWWCRDSDAPLGVWKVYAKDAQTAAEKFAEKADDMEREGPNRRREVEVARFGEQQWTGFVVWSETVVNYEARLKEASQP